MSRIFALPVACFAALLAGCGGGADTAWVKGTVTYDGKPLANAVITFIPKVGETKSAMTNASGVYECPDIALGDALVTVAVQEATDEAVGKAMKEAGEAAAKGKAPVAPPKPKFPQKYLDPAQSGLKYTVEAKADNKYDITLTK